jgi:hypothetical protein
MFHLKGGFRMVKHLSILLAGIAVCLALPFSSAAQTTGGIEGTVTDSVSGDSIAGALVILAQRGGGMTSTPIDTALTDGDGFFSFDSLAVASNYSLTITAISYLSSQERNVAVVAGDTTMVDILLSPVASGTSTISGIITDSSTDLPVGSALVIVYQSGTGSGGHGSTWTLIDSMRTAANGLYDFSDLAEGAYQIAVTAPGFTAYRSVNIQVVPDATITHDVALTPGTTGIIHATSLPRLTNIKTAAAGTCTLNGRNVMLASGATAKGIRIIRSAHNSGGKVLIP